MLNLIQSCRRHLDDVDETYSQHFVFASRTGLTMIVAGGACVIHGLLPFLFDHTGSRAIQVLAARIEARQRRNRVDRHDNIPAVALPYLPG